MDRERNTHYRSFSAYLRERFGGKVFRVSLDAGFTCPNRDGSLGNGGCAYCAGEGSWTAGEGSIGAGGASRPTLPLDEQVRSGKERARFRYGAEKFIAYFQAYTNTYAPTFRLKAIYDSVVADDRDFVALAVGTRPDCVDGEKLELLASYMGKGLEVWIELGLQTAKDEILRHIGRGHTAADFSRAVLMAHGLGLKVSAHVILGLPGEVREDAWATAALLRELEVEGVKLHNLAILEGTLMARWYRRGEVRPLQLAEYATRVVDFLERTRPEVAVERLVTDSSPRILIEPRWSLKKASVLAAIHGEFEARGTFQGKALS